ncbi:hypothetical protein HOY82DRAFT_635142 [Tuber indicum]|nr:hypothetical protein HOY82DRAFT_635142 [Tuber indicum]
MASAYEHGIDSDIAAPVSETSLPDSTVDTEYYLTEGLKGVKHRQYRGPRSFLNAMDEQVVEALEDNAGQYAVFCPITKQQLAHIDRLRETQHKGHRFLYLNHQQALIIKLMLGWADEMANVLFGSIIRRKSLEMGLQFEFVGTGSRTITSPAGRKEGDSTYAPFEFRHSKESWPTLVVESGVSQSLARLVVDSHWWLENSGGDVKIVILISVSRAARRIHFEKWEMVTTPDTRDTIDNPTPSRAIPTKTHEVDIADNVVTGAPLRLEFEKIMLRRPEAGEGDMVFDKELLTSFAGTIWRSPQ